MTESQKRNARRRLAKHRALSASQLMMSFKCVYWDLPWDTLNCRPMKDGQYVSWRGSRPTVGRVSMSTLDIPTVTCTYRLNAEDPAYYLRELKGVLNGIIKTIHTGSYSIITPHDGMCLSRSYRLECECQYGARAPWRLKWRGVDVETVVADVIAAVEAE